MSAVYLNTIGSQKVSPCERIFPANNHQTIQLEDHFCVYQ